MCTLLSNHAQERDPVTDAMQRTTTAVTMVSAGVKENVLPGKASAAVNLRLHPSDDLDGVIQRIEVNLSHNLENVVLPT